MSLNVNGAEPTLANVRLDAFNGTPQRALLAAPFR
jgi:hypothetical protein